MPGLLDVGMRVARKVAHHFVIRGDLEEHDIGVGGPQGAQDQPRAGEDAGSAAGR
ncbi:hypothetical protein I551_1115 [Mycobacterium ulcerans str. Harvey]|uniref:Uncharacterized protein n=1 Tax=Mycobacterium ulcerans str. Harvey TaxID=1299332 RepID=A0ABN0R6I5_MYCUL|nr:hypothetical protein I551_1115 [Mycobacterium ulcerans str. Harvey]